MAASPAHGEASPPPDGNSLAESSATDRPKKEGGASGPSFRERRPQVKEMPLPKSPAEYFQVLETIYAEHYYVVDQFVEIMGALDTDVIDVEGAKERVMELFRHKTHLILAFNLYLAPRYHFTRDAVDAYLQIHHPAKKAEQRELSDGAVAAGSKKKKPLPPHPRDAEGKTIFPVDVGGGITVVSIGKPMCERPGFRMDRYIYPVGYYATKKYHSGTSPEGTSLYHCRIKDSDGPAPLFEVTENDDPSTLCQANTPTGAWATAMERINKIRKMDMRASGPHFFGLTNPLVIAMMSELPHPHQCPFTMKPGTLPPGALGEDADDDDELAAGGGAEDDDDDDGFIFDDSAGAGDAMDVGAGVPAPASADGDADLAGHHGAANGTTHAPDSPSWRASDERDGDEPPAKRQRLA